MECFIFEKTPCSIDNRLKHAIIKMWQKKKEGATKMLKKNGEIKLGDIVKINDNAKRQFKLSEYIGQLGQVVAIEKDPLTSEADSLLVRFVDDRTWFACRMHCDLPEKENFMKEIKHICEQYNISISHEDIGGAFLLKKYNKEDMSWFEQARDTRVE